MSLKRKEYEIAVLGGGITGSSIFYVLSRYTDVKSAILLEKNVNFGQVNSSEKNNSQTLHFGDIETNYSFEKAVATKEASELVLSYLLAGKERTANIYSCSHKMALAVGEVEVLELKKRYEKFKTLFSELKWMDEDEIVKIEPLVVLGRKKSEKIAAVYSEKGIVVDFGRLAQDFARMGQENRADFDTSLGTKILSIVENENGFLINTSKGNVRAKKVVVAMCSHSLMFAKKMGYGEKFSILPVGGNYYTSERKVLNGKVYTMQSGKLPFAAIHGDPNIHNINETRFGPTANIMPFLERNKPATFIDFLKSSVNNSSSMFALIKVISDRLLLNFLFKSLVYAVPVVGTWAFVRLSRKIIPTLKYSDFRNGQTKAGIRPQLIDNVTGKLVMGEAEIIGKNIIFHVSPSPGATVCLSTAKKTVIKLMDFFQGTRIFQEDYFKKDLV